jgi:2-methylcitrate dehydratase
MITHKVRVHASAERLPREHQLAWKIAEVAASTRALDDDVVEMIRCRIVDNAAIALAAVNRAPVGRPAPWRSRTRAAAARRSMACRRHCASTTNGSPANATAVRELDFHDTFLAADYAHPGDSIAPLVAVAQQTGRAGADLSQGPRAGFWPPASTKRTDRPRGSMLTTATLPAIVATALDPFGPKKLSVITCTCGPASV